MGPCPFLGSPSAGFLPTGEFVPVGGCVVHQSTSEHSYLLPCSWLFLLVFWPAGCQLPGRVQVGLNGGVGGPCQQHPASRLVSCQTPKEDLCSKFGMDLKRGMLLRLARRDPQLHPNDPERRAAIYDKYKVRAWAWTSCPP